MNAQWHIQGVERVRLFQINWDDEMSENLLIDVDGELNPTRFPTGGISVGSEEAAIFQAALYESHPPDESGKCMYPHHALLLEDSAGNHLAQINICFLCNRAVASPDYPFPPWDREALIQAIQQAGLEVHNPKWFPTD